MFDAAHTLVHLDCRHLLLLLLLPPPLFRNWRFC
jgi:hypothetical protein